MGSGLWLAVRGSEVVNIYLFIDFLSRSGVGVGTGVGLVDYFFFFFCSGGGGGVIVIVLVLFLPSFVVSFAGDGVRVYIW